MKPKRRMRWLSFALLVMVMAACTPSTDDSAGACAGPLGDPIPLSGINAMTACCQAEQGQAHCLDNSRVPAEIQPFVASCDGGGYCIPDSFLATGAAKPPATCTAFGGQGVCLSRCIPQVSENEGLLRQDTCEGVDELCVPCINPIDMTETGACQLLELARCEGDAPPPGSTAACDDPSTCNYDDGCPAVLDPSTLPSCGPDAHCVDPALAGDDASRLGPCDDGTSLCVPDRFIETGGKFTAATCTSVAGAEGRCLSMVLPDVAAQADLLPQDTCAPSERCTPCFDPIDGTPTGACNLSCDTGPTQPPTTLAECCGGRARCVPSTSIPADQQDQLSEQECKNDQPGSLCVPDEILNDGPFPACSGNNILGNYTGVCLSSCLDFGIQGIVLDRGTCSSGFKCAPCTSFGQPTGAPGCPP